MKHHLIALGLFALMASAPALVAADPPPAGTATPAVAQTAENPPAVPAAEHKMYTGKDLTWTDCPPGFPKGAKIAVLNGDPSAPGPFTLRVTFPAGYKVAPHFHPTDENVTVISGEMYMALGDTWDESKGHSLSAGGFASMPAGMHHYAWSKKGAVIQVHAIGPMGITYVNPTDDPRNAKDASK